jgi:NTE family protein
MKNKQVTLAFLLLVLFSIPAFSLPAQDSTARKRPTVGLVLSGGGAKGFAYIGLLRAIQEAGLPIDYIGGSSIGSIVGGLYAIGYHPDSIAKMIRSQNWNDLLRDVIERKYIASDQKQEDRAGSIDVQGRGDQSPAKLLFLPGIQDQ